jgi:hypothetical protein
MFLTKINTKRIGELLDEFVNDHNDNTLKVAEQLGQIEKTEEE